MTAEQIKLLSEDVGILDIGVRPYSAALNSGAKTIGELVTKSPNDLLRLKNFGRKSLKQLEEALSRYGLRLGMTVDDVDATPAPRPTCGTCPHWEEPTGGDEVLGREDAGECRIEPSVNHRFRYHWCGQHPKMPAWIRDEWPKVKR